MNTIPIKQKSPQKTYLYSEVFNSIQGEGEYTGVPTAWLRFFLCNLQCNGFGQKDPTDPSSYVLPYKDLDPSDYDKITDLPVFEYGCDSSYSWAKKFKHLQHRGTVDDIDDAIRQTMTNEFNPDGSFRGQHMCFTGGEPLMKHAQECSTALVGKWIAGGDYPGSVTYETNGTQELSEEFVRRWSGFKYDVDLFFSVSPKLWTVAGEKAKKAIRPEIVRTYDDLSPGGQLKFVANGTDECWREIEDTIKLFRDAGVGYPVWIMPVGGTKEGQEEVAGDIANQAIARGYNVSARVHCYLWGNVIGT